MTYQCVPTLGPVVESQYRISLVLLAFKKKARLWDVNVTKYADNGLAKSEDELKHYFREYRRRAPLDYLLHDAQYRLASAVRTRVDSRSPLYQLAHKTWWFVGRRFGV